MNKKIYLVHLLSIFSMFFLSGILLIIGIDKGVFNENLILNAIHESDYYTENYNRFEESVTSILEETGIPTEVITSIIPKNQFYISGRTYVSDVFSQDDLTDKKQEIYDLIENTITQYYQKQYISLDENGEVAIAGLSNAISNTYIERIQNIFVKEIAAAHAKYINWLLVGFIVLLIGLLINIVMIMMLSKYIYRGIMQMVYICIASGVLNLLFSALIQHKIEYSDLTPDYYVEFLKAYISSSINCIRFVSALVFAVAILLWIIAAQIKINVNRLKSHGGSTSGSRRALL